VQAVKENGSKDGILYIQKQNKDTHQFYLLCKNYGKNKNATSTIRKGCLGLVYATFKSGKYVIKKVVSYHNHPPLTREEINTIPQNFLLSDIEKEESLKLFYRGENIKNICNTIFIQFHPDEKDPSCVFTIKTKLKNYLNNKIRDLPKFSFADLISDMNKNYEDLVWISFEVKNTLQPLFFTFRSNVEKDTA
jgi:hypothetical protein